MVRHVAGALRGRLAAEQVNQAELERLKLLVRVPRGHAGQRLGRGVAPHRRREHGRLRRVIWSARPQHSPAMARLHLLRVFCGEGGSGGNPLAVFLDRSLVPPERRQAVAAELGLSETVFVDDARQGVLRIFTPATELEFAGHPTVGGACPGGRARRGAAAAGG